MGNFIESRPQRLCLMCGKCCRVVTAPIPYKKLLELDNEDNKGAKDFLSVFEPYPSIDDARKIHPEVVENIFANLKKAGEPTDEITFYKCKYLSDNNLCGIYEKRPELCKIFPSSQWAVVPPGCGYEGYLFQCKEKIKQNVRKYKEDLLDYEAELKTVQDSERKSKLELAAEKTKNIIMHYSKYGSENW